MTIFTASQAARRRVRVRPLPLALCLLLATHAAWADDVCRNPDGTAVDPAPATTDQGNEAGDNHTTCTENSSAYGEWNNASGAGSSAFGYHNKAYDEGGNAIGTWNTARRFFKRPCSWLASSCVQSAAIVPARCEIKAGGRDSVRVPVKVGPSNPISDTDS